MRGCSVKPGSILKAVAVAVAIFASGPAAASVVMSIPGGTLQAMPASNQFTAGPVVFGDSVTWTASNSFAVFGWTDGYGFNDNGTWAGVPPMAGVNTNLGSMTFTFASDLSAVGGIIDWAKLGSDYQNSSMSIYNSNGDLLETLILMSNATNQVTPDSFYGFSRGQADIHSFVLSNGFVGLRNLTTLGSSAVPEPGTWAMMLLGFGAIGMSVRRRRKVAALV